MTEAREVGHQADAARLLGLTRARVSQPLDQTLLAPDVQGMRLYLAETCDALSERALLPTVCRRAWERPRKHLLGA